MSRSTLPKLAKRSLALLAALLTLTCLSLAGAGAASAAIQLGVYSGAPGQSTAMEDPRVLDNHIAMVGRAPDILHDYSNVTEPLLTETKIANLVAHDTTPMITWQLFKSGWSGSVITLPDIAAGHYDSHLREAARLARTLPFDVMIRFAHEMNGDWYPWRPGGEAGNVGSSYVDAWRHIVSVFRAEGATNVKWVWSPNVDYGDYPFAQFFPGDEWVDYVALDGYNWGTGGIGVNKWQSFSEVFASSYAQITQMSSKPVMIAETSSSEAGGDKAAWIRQSFLAAIPKQFPRIAAVLWFDRDMEQDWRVNSSTAALDAYREVASSTLYGGTVDVAYTEPALPKKKAKKTLRSLRVTPTVTVAKSGAADASARPQHGTELSGRIVYRLTESTTVRIAIERRTKRGRYAKRLTVARKSGKGRSRVAFSQLRDRFSLKPGTYRVTVTALVSGETAERHDAFRVVKPKRR